MVAATDVSLICLSLFPNVNLLSIISPLSHLDNLVCKCTVHPELMYLIATNMENELFLSLLLEWICPSFVEAVHCHPSYVDNIGRKLSSFPLIRWL